MDSVGSILLNMSTTFQEAIPDSEKLTLNEDATLKWRGLLNNTYAAKDGREMRKRSASVKELSTNNSVTEDGDDREGGASGNSSSGGGNNSSSSGVKETINADNNNGDDKLSDVDNSLEKNQSDKSNEQEISTEINDGSPEKQENTVEKLDEVASTETKVNITEQTETSNTNTSENSITSTDNNVTTNINDKSNTDKTRVKTRTASKINALQSDRSLRSKSHPAVSPINLPSVKRNGRGRKKTEITETSELDTSNEVKLETPLPTIDVAEPEAVTITETGEEKRDSEKPRLIMKIRQNRSVVLPDPVQLQPRRRGRKPRMQLIPDGGRQTRSAKDVEQKHAENNQRPLRRIKPTPKILASDELREGFVQQHCARLSVVAVDDLKHDPSNDESGKNDTKSKTLDDSDKRLTRDKKRREISNNTKVNLSEKTPPVLTAPENLDSKKASHVVTVSVSDNKTIKRSLSFSESLRNASRRPCPDPGDFLRDIKNSKLNIHRSPELSKLNKKQLKKLQKVKEKHFQSLGLQKVKRPTDSDTEDNSDENEEFLPKRRVENVGRSGVTLRLRTFRKESKDGTNRNGDQPIQKKRPREITVTSNESPVPVKKPNTTTTVANIDLTNELQVVPAGPSTAVIDVDNLHLICYCAQPSKYFLQRTAAISHCCAIDEIEGQKIGCTNEVHGDLLQLLRPSVRTSYMVLCDSHKKRLISHNCCAGCGIFLTQGIFSLCPEKHFFHRDCTMKFILNAPYDPNSPDFQGPTLAFKCPHCGTDTPDNSFRVTMKSENTPVFFTNQKHHVQRAKMSITNRPQVSANSFMLNVEQLIPDNVIEAMRKVSYQLKHQPPKVFTAKDLFHAICNDAGAEKIAEIIGK